MAPTLGMPPQLRATEKDESSSFSFPWLLVLETLYRRRWAIFVATLVGLSASTALVMLTPPVFKAQAKVLLMAQPGAGTREDAMPDKQIAAELALLKSPVAVKSVLEQYRENGDSGREEELDGLDPEIVAKRIEVERVDRSNVVQLGFVDRDPEWAARFINDLLVHHVERVTGLNEQINTRSFFQQQKDLAAQRWLEARQALTEFREEQGAKFLIGDANQLRSVISNLEAERVDSETRVLQLQAKVTFLSGEINSLPETVAAETRVPENDSTATLTSRILELQIERSELLSRYTTTSTVIRNIDRQIEETKQLLEEQRGSGATVSETTTEVNPSYQTLQVDLVSSRAELTEAQARIKALNAQLAQYRSRLGEHERAAAELERLQNEVESARLADENYRQREEEARLSAAFDESKIVNMIVVERAVVPPKPESTNRNLKIVVGILAGLVMGTMWAFCIDWLDPSVKSSLQAERLVGVPVIAEVPAP